MLKKVFFSSLIVLSSLYANQDDFLKYKQSFKNYQQQKTQNFTSYKNAQEEAYAEYKKELSKYWETPSLTSKKKLVTYTEDKKTRTTFDFKNQKLTLEVIANSKKEAQKKFESALEKAITIDTKTYYETDPLEKKLASLEKRHTNNASNISSKPIISTAIFQKKPSKKDVDSYVNQHIKKELIGVEKNKKVKDKNTYTLNISLPNNTTMKLSKLYYEDVKKHSQVQRIPVSLIYAIMHTESSFNPMARSHIPAYGLMQIVPKTAGIDAYYYLYKRKKLVSGSYLYNSSNNIRMGSAYLHILYYRYLREIKNPLSRLYCTIAAYNTGAGNIAWAYTKTYNMKKAAPRINTMEPQEVYDYLLQNLRFEEPKRYLVKVTKRMKSYRMIYGG